MPACVLIGAGPSCLAFGLAFDGDCQILEKESRPGGLCRSVNVGGGVFDLGGHSFHTPHDDVFELVNCVSDDPLFLQKRNAKVFSHASMIDYPFQKSFGQIPNPEVVTECEAGLRPAGDLEGQPPRNLEDYLVQKFGGGIAKHFMLPYNRKLWARDLRTIACDWVGQRIANPRTSTKEKRFGTTGGGGERRPLQQDSTVGYPKNGGFEEIFRSMAARLDHIHTGCEVLRIDTQSRRVHCRNGRIFDYDVLVNSMPLPLLLRCIDGTPPELQSQADSLEAMSLRIEFLLVNHRLETDIQRIYCSDPDIPPHKLALNHNSSDSLRSRDCHAIMAEVSTSSEKSVDEDQIAPRTIEWLCDLGILPSPASVTWRGHQKIRFGYPVYTHNRLSIVTEIKQWLASHDIHTIGRFGEWEYWNSDKCMLKGIELARSLSKSKSASIAAFRSTILAQAGPNQTFD